MTEPKPKPPEEVVAERLHSEYERLAVSDDDVNVDEWAEEFERKMWQSCRDDYLGWLRTRGRLEFRVLARNWIDSRRQRARVIAGRRQFLDAAEKLEAGGDPDAIVDQWRINVGDGTYRKLMDATGRDLDRGIERQAKVASSAALEEAFYRYLRKKTPDDATVGSVMSADEILRVREQVERRNVVKLPQAA